MFSHLHSYSLEYTYCLLLFWIQHRVSRVDSKNKEKEIKASVKEFERHEILLCRFEIITELTA